MVAKTYIDSDQLFNTSYNDVIGVKRMYVSATVKSSFDQNVNYYPTYTFPPPVETPPNE
jgi:hypothetical protein